MKRRKWQVWNDADVVLFEGNKADAYRFFRHGGGSRAGLHVGYEI